MAEQTVNTRNVSRIIDRLHDEAGQGRTDAAMRRGGRSIADRHDAGANVNPDFGQTNDQTDIHQIAYMSRGTRHFWREGMADLCRETIVRNQDDGITGLLVYDGKRFLQVIEGEVDAVCSLMSRIVIDDRHESITYISKSPVKARAFETFSLLCVGFDQTVTTAQLLADVKNSVRKVANPALAASFIGFASLAK